MPPSTPSTVPVVQPDRGMARYAIAFATSSAPTSRPIGPSKSFAPVSRHRSPKPAPRSAIIALAMIPDGHPS
jgi:hypothetical protein